MSTTDTATSTTTSASSYGRKLDLWESHTEWVMAILALIFLGIYAYQVIYNLYGFALAQSEAAMNIIWAVFLVDYLTRLALAHNRWAWIKHNLLDLASVALPFLRPLRLIRLIILLQILHRTTGEKLRNRIVTYTVSSTALLVLTASLAILEAERNIPGATITNYPDALWWSLVTITTVGYGDYTPVTGEGRLITLALMVGGIALVGVITATLASWITDRVNTGNQKDEDTNHDRLHTLEQMVSELRDEIALLRSSQTKE